jgi:hypothetical protein
MQKLISASLIVSIGWLTTAAAAQKPSRNCAIPRTQRITLDFERYDRSSGTVWLKLTNHTIWAIRIPVDIRSMNRQHEPVVKARYDLQEYEPGPAMQILYANGKKEPPDEPQHPPVPKIHHIDVLTERLINPKQSVIFSVPKEHLARNVMLTLNLRYDWENLGTEDLDGPFHSVMIRGTDMPEDVQLEIP